MPVNQTLKHEKELKWQILCPPNFSTLKKNTHKKPSLRAEFSLGFVFLSTPPERVKNNTEF